MSSPQISFRLSSYHLARGLKLIRTIEPTYIPSSVSQLVKTLYLDYLSKTSLNKSSDITDHDLAEILNLISVKPQPMSLGTFQQAIRTISSSDDLKEEDPSKITSVSDFSPPADWQKS